MNEWLKQWHQSWGEWKHTKDTLCLSDFIDMGIEDGKTRWKTTIVCLELLLTVFENHRKSLIQHCERSELHLHFEWTKVT